MDEIDTLEDFYEEVEMLTPGTEFEFEGYTLRKVEVGGVSPSDHSEVMAVNPDGNKVESYTLSAFDSCSEWRSKLMKLIEYDPDDLEDWLTRER